MKKNLVPNLGTTEPTVLKNWFHPATNIYDWICDFESGASSHLAGSRWQETSNKKF